MWEIEDRATGSGSSCCASIPCSHTNNTNSITMKSEDDKKIKKMFIPKNNNNNNKTAHWPMQCGSTIYVWHNKTFSFSSGYLYTSILLLYVCFGLSIEWYSPTLYVHCIYFTSRMWYHWMHEFEMHLARIHCIYIMWVLGWCANKHGDGWHTWGLSVHFIIHMSM